MDTADLFLIGESQAVRLPKEYRFAGDEVVIKRMGKAVVLLPKQEPWQTLFDALGEFPADLQIVREQPVPEERPPLE